jgi:hypothetical protein
MDSAPVTALPKLAFAPMFSISSTIPFIFYIVLFVYVLFTAVMYYHWTSYARDAKTLTITGIAYFAITIPLLIAMATAALIV